MNIAIVLFTLGVIMVVAGYTNQISPNCNADVKVKIVPRKIFYAFCTYLLLNYCAYISYLGTDLLILGLISMHSYSNAAIHSRSSSSVFNQRTHLWRLSRPFKSSDLAVCTREAPSLLFAMSRTTSSSSSPTLRSRMLSPTRKRDTAPDSASLALAFRQACWQHLLARLATLWSPGYRPGTASTGMAPSIAPRDFIGRVDWESSSEELCLGWPCRALSTASLSSHLSCKLSTSPDNTS